MSVYMLVRPAAYSRMTSTSTAVVCDSFGLTTIRPTGLVFRPAIVNRVASLAAIPAGWLRLSISLAFLRLLLIIALLVLLAALLLGLGLLGTIFRLVGLFSLIGLSLVCLSGIRSVGLALLLLFTASFLLG